MFKKYLDVERLGKSDVDGILGGRCLIFPKLDGANGSIWIEQDEQTKINEICCGSRNLRLSGSNTNRGFYNYVLENAERFTKILEKHPSWILYGEWLVPHTVRGYRKDSWKQFYVFDVFDRDTGKYLHFVEYQHELAKLGIKYIPCTAIYTNPSLEQLVALLGTNN